MNTDSPGMFLLSENLVGNKDTSLDGFIRYSIPYFLGEEEKNWQGSNAQAWCRNFQINVFSPLELSAIAATTKSDGPYTYINKGKVSYSRNFIASDKILDEDRIFFSRQKKRITVITGSSITIPV